MTKRINILLVGSLLTLAMFGTAMAGPFEDGEAAYQSGDYAAALRLLRPLADQRNPRAEETIGEMYRYGEGVPPDQSQADTWLRKAADQFSAMANQGNADAQASLAAMYEFGKGVAEDHAKAIMWYRRAADQGNAVAEVHLGLNYQKGYMGLPKDIEQAAIWFHKAADQGNVDAQEFARLYVRVPRRWQAE